MSEVQNPNVSLIPVETNISPDKILPVTKTSKLGTLVKRVSPSGRVLGDTMLVTGAHVSGPIDDPDSTKYIGARELEQTQNGMKISQGSKLHLDPTLTVVRVGEIDYLDPKNAKFFAEVKRLEQLEEEAAKRRRNGQDLSLPSPD